MRKIALGLLLISLTACGAAGTPAGDSTGATGSGNVIAGSGQAPTNGEQPNTKPLPSGGPAGSGNVTTGSGQVPAGGDQPMTMPLPSGGPGGDLSGGPAELQKNVASLLATTTGLPVANLQLQNAEAMEWPNGALGCPKQGMSYTEMIVPGFKLTFTDGAKTYEVHTNQTGETAVLCENGNPKSLGNS